MVKIDLLLRLGKRMRETFVLFHLQFLQSIILCPILVKEPKWLFWIVLYPFALKFTKNEKELDFEIKKKWSYLSEWHSQH